MNCNLKSSPFAGVLSIILCTKDRPKSLEKTLKAIRENELLLGLDVFVHDDSTSSKVENSAIGRKYSAFILSSDRPRGPTGGRNACLKAAQTEFCLCLDDDVAPLWLLALPDTMAKMKDHPRLAVVGFRCYRPSDGDVSPGFDVRAGPTEGFHGGACLMRRKAILSVGGFRELLFFGAEDTDLALTLIRCGWDVHFEPSIVMQHDCEFGGRDTWKSGFIYSRNLIISRYAQRGGLGGVLSGIKGALGRLHYRFRARLTGTAPVHYPILGSITSMIWGSCVGIWMCFKHHHELRAPLPNFEDVENIEVEPTR